MEQRRESVSSHRKKKQQIYDEKLVSRYERGLIMEKKVKNAREKDRAEALRLLSRSRERDK